MVIIGAVDIMITQTAEQAIPEVGEMAVAVKASEKAKHS